MAQQPSPQFESSLRAALAFWQRRVENEAPADLDPDRHNLYRAVQFGLALPATRAAAAEVAACAFPFVFARGYLPEWLPLMEQASGALPSLPPRSQFTFLTRLGQVRRLNRKLDDAIRAARDGVAVAEQIGDPLISAEARLHLGRAHRDAHAYLEAEKQLQTALQILDPLVGKAEEVCAARVNNTLGRVAHDLGRLADAKSYMARAVALVRQHEHPVRLAEYLQDLGNIYRDAGDHEIALACYEEALALLHGTGHWNDRVRIQYDIGVFHFVRSEYGKAEAAFRAIDLQFLRETGNLHLLAQALNSLGNSLLYQQRFGDAVEALGESVALWGQLEDDLELANTVGSLGEALAGLGEKGEANAMFGQALALLEKYPANPKAGRLRAFFKAEQEKLAGQGSA